MRYFLTVAREGSLTNAANLLYVTQPTISRQLKDLENELGKKLFIRSNYSVKLTDEGLLFKKRAEDILNMVDKTKTEFITMDDIVGGDVYIGAAETDSLKYFARIAKELQKYFPNIRYHFYSGNSEVVTEKLDKGLIDFGIIVQQPDLSKYNYITIPSKNIWGVIMRRDSPLASKESIEVEDLLQVPLICSRQAISHEFAGWFGEQIDKINIISTYDLLYNASIMVKEEMGYAIAFDKIIDTGRDSELCFRPLKPSLESGINIIWKNYQVFSKAAEAFKDQLKQKYCNSND